MKIISRLLSLKILYGLVRVVFAKLPHVGNKILVICFSLEVSLNMSMLWLNRVALVSPNVFDSMLFFFFL